MPTVHYVSRDFLKKLGVSNPPRTPRQIKTHLRRDPDSINPLGEKESSSEPSRASCKHGSSSESNASTTDGNDTMSKKCGMDKSIGTFSLGDAAFDQSVSEVLPSSITVVEGDTTMPKAAAPDGQRARTGTLTLPTKIKPSTRDQQVGQVPAPLANNNSKKKGPRLFKCPRSRMSDPPKMSCGRGPNVTITDEAVTRVLIPPMTSNPTCVPVEEPSQVLAGLCAAGIKPIPTFQDLINFPRPIIENHEGIKQCVMCGEMCACRAKDTNRATIPKKNRGMCNACDRNVWHHRPSGHYIKFCKGCKNFLSWPASFGKSSKCPSGRSEAMKTNCADCRERARERYRLKKNKEKADARAKTATPASSKEIVGKAPVHKSPAKSDNEPCAVKAGEVDTILPRNGEPADEASSHLGCPISTDDCRTAQPDWCDQAFELESDSETVESESPSDPLPLAPPVNTPNSAPNGFEKAQSADSKDIGGEAPVNDVPNSLNDCPDEIDGMHSAKEKPSSSHVPPPMIYPVAYPPPHYFYPLPQPPGIYHPSFPPPIMPGNYFYQPYYPRNEQDDDAKAAAAAAMMGLGQRPSLAAPANQPVYLPPGMPSPYEACPQPHIAPENAEETVNKWHAGPGPDI